MTTISLTAYDLAARFIGMREVAGGVANPAILAMLRLDESWPEEDETPWCLTGEIEILTAEGFRSFATLRQGVPVAQVDPFLRVSWAVPTRYIHTRHRGPLVHMSSRDVDLTCDPQHRFLGVWNRPGAEAGPLELRPITDLTSSLFIPRVGTECEIDAREWTDADLALLAAFLSDGFVHRGRIAVQVSKVRKLQALAALSPIHTYEAKRAYGMSTVPLTTHEFAAPAWMATAFTDYKVPKWDVLRRWSRRQLVTFLDAYATFDGHQKNGSIHLYTSLPKLRDWLQAALTLAGFHSAWRRSSSSPFTGTPCDEIVYAPAKATRVFRPEMRAVEDGEADLYCVEVPTGVIIIRDRSGMIIPIGNCSAFANYICWLLRLPRSKSLLARSWLDVGVPVHLTDAQVGFDLVVLSRPPSPTAGHVGFFAGQTGIQVTVLGGNQGNQVSLADFSAARVIGVRTVVI